MNIKDLVISELLEAKFHITQAIYMVENKGDCLQTHKLIDKSIFLIKESRRKMLNGYMEECLTKLFKDSSQGKKERQEIINLIHT